MEIDHASSGRKRIDKGRHSKLASPALPGTPFLQLVAGLRDIFPSPRLRFAAESPQDAQNKLFEFVLQTPP